MALKSFHGALQSLINVEQPAVQGLETLIWTLTGTLHRPQTRLISQTRPHLDAFRMLLESSHTLLIPKLGELRTNSDKEAGAPCRT